MKRGYGIREVLACRNDIVNILNEGYTISYMHRKLFSSGKITIRYSHFHKLLKRMNIEPRLINKIGDIIKYPHDQYELISRIENNNGNQLPTGQDDSFGIIKKPEDEVF